MVDEDSTVLDLPGGVWTESQLVDLAEDAQQKLNGSGVFGKGRKIGMTSAIVDLHLPDLPQDMPLDTTKDSNTDAFSARNLAILDADSGPDEYLPAEPKIEFSHVCDRFI